MEPRLDYTKISPDPLKPLMNLEGYVRRSGLEHSLLHLMKIRVSQINGCGFCIDMHWKDTRAAGETEQRLYGLSTWRECPFYTARERAALEWAEAVTLLAQGPVSDEVYRRAREQFGEKELVDLTFGVVAINSWNRLCVPFRVVPGSYQPGSIPVA
jgi:AhpD family alkylhydroperoxidase